MDKYHNVFSKKSTNHCLSTFHVWLKKSWHKDTDFLHLFQILCPIQTKNTFWDLATFTRQNRAFSRPKSWLCFFFLLDSPRWKLYIEKKILAIPSRNGCQELAWVPFYAPDAMLSQRLRKKGVRGFWLYRFCQTHCRVLNKWLFLINAKQAKE